MRSLASFIMRGRMQAVLVVILFAGLSLPLAPFIYLSGGAVALATLRLGPQSGLSVILISGLLISLLSLVAMGSLLPGLVFMGMVWLPVWVLSAILRQSRSLDYVIAITCGIGLLLTLLVHLLLSDPVMWWQQVLDQLLATMGEMGSHADIAAITEQLARLMTAIIVVALTLNILFSLFVGRWWQSQLYNPGGFKLEFHQLRLPKLLAWIAVAVMLASMFVQQGAGMLAGNLMIVLVFFYLLQGLAIIHSVVAERKLSVGWLIGLYLAMTIALPQIAALLMLLGVSDSWIDIRRRLALPKEDQQKHDDQGSPD
ncbi:FIG003573: hypothetical protein [hydrothermal vent metagenome]|uniref:DUF2232 domain-containing protein n=1 Tax=hydrothermal vent metagenome TaxID=652676 RepID=A0A3B0ZJ11_9ZZZZ